MPQDGKRRYPVGRRGRGPHAADPLCAQKALEMGHRIIIVVNKIDRPDARLDEVGDEVLEPLLDLDARRSSWKARLFSVPGAQAPLPLPV